MLRPIIGDKKGGSSAVQVTPDSLNSYFSQIGRIISTGVPQPGQHVPIRLPRVHTCKFELSTVDIDTLRGVVLGMKPSTYTGVHGISVQMIQKFFNGIGHVLLNIVNSSLTKNEVPSSWKHAMITPLPKSTNATEPADHRPISILPAITKVIERIVQQQLISYFVDNHLFSPSQHGYRRAHSTETALSVLTERIYRGIDQGHVTIVVMLDLSKCFDVVNHQILLGKLALYGVNPDWFAAYLSGHKQQVKVRRADGEEIISSIQPNDTGVYQGGSLSCLLYSIYSLDMTLYIEGDVEGITFADDTQLAISGPKSRLPKMIETLENTLSSLSDWFAANRLKINANKTQLIMFGSKPMLKNVPEISLNFNGSVIRESRVVKNLGLYMDRHMTFSDHVSSVVAKCSGALIALMHAKHSLPKASIKPIVNALVISSVRYCLSIYGTCTKTERDRIQKVINFAARVVSGLRKHDHVSQVIRDLNWLTADQLVTYHRTSLVHKIVTTGYPEALYTCLCASDHSHGYMTRQSDELKLPHIRSETGRRQLAYGGIQYYNRVHKAQTRNKTTFRTALIHCLRGDGAG